jgi:hypothetical protein
LSSASPFMQLHIQLSRHSSKTRPPSEPFGALHSLP